MSLVEELRKLHDLDQEGERLVRNKSKVESRYRAEETPRYIDLSEAHVESEQLLPCHTVEHELETKVAWKCRYAVIPPWKPWGVIIYRRLYGYVEAPDVTLHTIVISKPWNLLLLLIFALVLYVNWPLAIAAVGLVLVLPSIYTQVVRARRRFKNRGICRRNSPLWAENEKINEHNTLVVERYNERKAAERHRLQEQENLRVQKINEEIIRFNNQVKVELEGATAEAVSWARRMEDQGAVVSTYAPGMNVEWERLGSPDIVRLINILETGQAASLDIAWQVYNDQLQQEYEEKQRRDAEWKRNEEIARAEQQRLEAEARRQQAAADREAADEQRKINREEDEKQCRQAMAEEAKEQTRIMRENAQRNDEWNRKHAADAARYERRRQQDVNRQILWGGFK